LIFYQELDNRLALGQQGGVGGAVQATGGVAGDIAIGLAGSTAIGLGATGAASAAGATIPYLEVLQQPV
jgi:hypothetical protein